jgi:RRXRR protein
MSKVFLLDTCKRPLDPVHPAWARKLLSTGQAAVFRRYPFTLILKKEVREPVTQPLRLKLDPGSKTTGIAIVNDASGEVVFAAELTHRGQQITSALDRRRDVRRSRRQRTTRYRKPRFDNRKKPRGWLAPSIMHRIDTTETWVRRLLRVCPVGAISQEVVRFDIQQMEKPEIAGIEYQQGTLACEPCNIRKGTQNICEFLNDDPTRLAGLLAQAKAPLRDAAAMNTTRWRLSERLQTFGLPIECSSGGRTKFNRITRGIEKSHWADAACVGASTPEQLAIEQVVPLLITAKGHGSRQMCRMDRFGFPRTGPKQAKRVKGFQTGDIVRAVVPGGKKQGTYVGRVAVRRTGSFNIVTHRETVQGISYRHCTALYRCDGYEYI